MHRKPLVYLDSAATYQKPQTVIRRHGQFLPRTLRHSSSSYLSARGLVHRALSAVQAKGQRFLNAEKTEEIIFTRGATESINLVAYSFGKAFVKPEDEILVSAMEHHSNIVPWQILCEDRWSDS